MFDKTDIRGIFNNSITGMKIKCEMPMGEDKNKIVEAEIIGKYPHFARVTHENITWCVKWIDVLKFI